MFKYEKNTYIRINRTASPTDKLKIKLGSIILKYHDDNYISHFLFPVLTY